MRRAGRARRRGRQADRRVPALPRLPGRRATQAVTDAVTERAGPGADDRRQAGPRDRARPRSRTRPRSSSPASSRVARRRSARRYRALTKKLVRQRDPARQGPHRRPRPHRHPHALGRGRGGPAGARLGAVRARRDPDPRRHDAEHAPHGAEARHARRRRTRKRYMHNYNFPPYSTGETGRVGSPKRREIGHGALAERALLPVLPAREEFPYAIRQVSEALGSNGSTSMGSVCASTMSLLQRRCAAARAGRRHRDGPGLRHRRRRDASTSR